MIDQSTSQLKRGTFLIASPSIDCGIFYRSVILLCDHSSIGSFGLIINKPIHVEPKEKFFLPEAFLTKVNLRAAGPTQPNQVILIQSRPCKEGTTLEICRDVYLNENLECIQESPFFPQTLVCLGYSGWAMGALEKELLNGIWFLCPATQLHVFDTSPHTLWRTLLREMGGKYKTLSLIPENLDLN